jgi:hypothetical protein
MKPFINLTIISIIILSVLSFSACHSKPENAKTNKETELQTDSLPVENKKSEYLFSLYKLSQTYFNKGNDNKALELLNKILKEAEADGKKDIQSAVHTALSRYYESKNDIKKALYHNKIVHDLRINRKEIPSVNLIRAIMFYKINQPDSVEYYAKLALMGNDTFVADVAYTLLRDLEIERGNDMKAFLHQKNITELFNNLESNISSAAMQQKYKQEQLTNENNRLKIKQREKDIVLLTIIIIIILVSAGFYILYLRQKRLRDQREMQINEELLRNKAYQLEQENLLLKQNEEISRLREKESLLRESLIRRINLFKKLPSISGQENSDKINDETSSRKIFFTKVEWDELFKGIDEVYPGFCERLKQRFPDLDEEDIRFCCLVRINVNLQDLSDIYCLSKAAITKKKYRIKKDKLGICDATASLDDCLKEL